jgi:hypothetical protein
MATNPTQSQAPTESPTSTPQPSTTSSTPPKRARITIDSKPAATNKGKGKGKGKKDIAAASSSAPIKSEALVKSDAISAHIQAIAALSDPRIKSISVSSRAVKAWALARSGHCEEEISAILGCSLIQAQQGIITVNAWMASVGNDILNAKANEEAMIGIEGTGKALQEARQASRVIAPPKYDDEGNMVAEAFTVPDHQTRLEAIKVTAQFAKEFRPPANTIINAGNTTNIVGGNGGGGGKSNSFENRVRVIREKHGLHNDETQIIDAIVEEGDEDDIEDDAEYMDDGADGGR